MQYKRSNIQEKLKYLTHWPFIQFLTLLRPCYAAFTCWAPSDASSPIKRANTHTSLCQVSLKVHHIHSRLTLRPPSTEKEMLLRTARPASAYFTVRPWTSSRPRLGQKSWAWGLSMMRSGRLLPPAFPGSSSSDGRSMNLNTRSTERICQKSSGGSFLEVFQGIFKASYKS